ncbi:HAMP domain-containing histidine kinase [Alkalihalobacillus oceani]|uniref:sensor histidine kinase n=1 Tax=Halalkalibacter oceani TaxID=1653776 RepID=UPI00203E42E7|nr:HAMP domain-containing sensor histidine kinase [Halalkalibacter oceani]MCM3761419.1 HAMP domain-containing histidine kinase [Halalkalibacter oceani]
MGMLKRKHTKTLRRRITSSFYLILASSIVATLCAWGILFAVFWQLIQNERLHPANYYENQLPEIVKVIDHQGDVLQESMQEVIEREIPLEGIDYQVVNLDGEIVYGTMQEQYLSSAKDLVNHLHQNLYDQNKIVRFYPLFQDGTLNGAIGFRYQLSVMAANQESTMVLYSLAVLAFIFPFLFFYLFAYLFGKRISFQIEKPFNEIIASANKIRNHDLDFSLLHIDSIEELNQLVLAFEEMKEALKDSLERQWGMERERREMVTAIAHDLKTPLTIIKGHVDVLLESKNPNPERVNHYLHTIQKGCVRSIQLLQELNEVSQVAQADYRLHFSKTDLTNWVEEKASQFQLLAEGKQIVFKWEIRPSKEDEHKPVFIDPGRLDQLLNNVFTNSLRYTQPGGEIVWISTRKDPYIEFEIFDNGPGFSSSNISNVFKKFYREDPARAGESGHAGLGLFIAQTIAQKHGGNIVASNREEGGAYVKVVIKNMISG